MTGATAKSRTAPAAAAAAIVADRVRADFPILRRMVGDKPLVYLDNAATTQKPSAVIDAVSSYYTNTNANIHRGVHTLSMEATDAHERARATVAGFIGAPRPEQIVFTRGTTEAINLVAQAFCRPSLRPGDEILITELEHHSNIVPWQMLREQTGAVLRVAPIDDAGQVVLDEFERLLNDRTRLAAFAHVSNALGTVNPVERMTEMAHARGVPVLIDGAQAVPHAPVNVASIGCDFYAFSGHKVYGPTGIGALYARDDLFDRMQPYQGGGDMILSVTFDKTIYNKPPQKFEAGTPNIAGAVGLGAAIDYLRTLGMPSVESHERDLLAYATDELLRIPGVRLIGTADRKAAVISFVVDGIHPHDLGTILDREGVAIRTGHHCAQPVMDRFGVPATARASLAVYNTRGDVDALAAAVRRAIEVFR